MPATGCAGRRGNADIMHAPAPATTDDKPPTNHMRIRSEGAIIGGVELHAQLDDWTDWDGAAFLVGRALGLFKRAAFPDVKSVFWTDNRLGNGLHAVLLDLVEAGVLERREEPDEQLRWRRG
jgi:hypothetical protein